MIKTAKKWMLVILAVCMALCALAFVNLWITARAAEEGAQAKVTGVVGGIQAAENRYLVTLELDITGTWNGQVNQITVNYNGEEDILLSVAKATDTSVYLLATFDKCPSGEEHLLRIAAGTVIGNMTFSEEVTVAISKTNALKLNPAVVTMESVSLQSSNPNGRIVLFPFLDKDLTVLPEHYAKIDSTTAITRSNARIVMMKTPDGAVADVGAAFVYPDASGENMNRLYFYFDVDDRLKIPVGTQFYLEAGIYTYPDGCFVLEEDMIIYCYGWLQFGKDEPVEIDAGEGSLIEGVARPETGAFILVLPENQISVNPNVLIQQTTNASIWYNGEIDNGITLSKATADRYRVNLDKAGITAKEGDVVRINGSFVVTATNYVLSVDDCAFAYVNGNWEKVEPKITVRLNGEPVTDDVIAIEIGAPVSSLTATASTVLSSDIEVEIDIPQEAVAEGCFVKGNYSVTFTAVESQFGYTAEIVKTLKVDDTEPPVITVTDLKTEYDEGEKLSYTVSATDNLDGTVEVSVHKEAGMEDGDGNLLPGTWTITFSAVDSAENTAETDEYRITVHDKTPPVISVGGTTEYVVGWVYEQGSHLGLEISVTDNVSAESAITVTVTVPEEALSENKLKMGVWTVEITAEDEAGNFAEKEVEITVVDKISPVISIVGSKTEYKQGDTPDIKVTVTDNVDTVIDDFEIEYPDGALDADGKLLPGVWEITVTAEDSSGNEAVPVVLEITVAEADTAAPVITVNGPKEYTEGDEIALVPSAVDDQDGTVPVSVNIPEEAQDENGKLVAGTWVIEFTAVDSAGNTVTVPVTITVTAESGASGGCSSFAGTGVAAVGGIAIVAAVFAAVKKRSKN